MSWSAFALVFAAFFVTHTVPVRPKVKARLQGVLGVRGFTIAYSTLSLCMLGLLIAAARNAPYVALWPQTVWQRHVVLVGMFLVCLIAAFAIGRPNPFSFGGARNNHYDPTRAGIIRLTRHPLLLALALWAGLHLLPNGDLAHVILFGVFLGFALLGRWIIDRRKKRQMGSAVWHALRAETAQAPLVAPAGSRAEILLRAFLAIGVFLILLLLHEPVIGAYALPV
jgi:uncharacterized membrane protein